MANCSRERRERWQGLSLTYQTAAQAKASGLARRKSDTTFGRRPVQSGETCSSHDADPAASGRTREGVVSLPEKTETVLVLRPRRSPVGR